MPFECKVCLISPADLRIYQCPRGHSICEKCLVKIFTRAQGGGQPKCPECRCVYPSNPVRNYGLEQELSTGAGQSSRPPFSPAEVGLGRAQGDKEQEDLVDSKTVATAAVAAVAGVGIGLLGAWLFGGGNKNNNTSRRQQ